MSVRFEDTGAGDPGLAASEVTASDLDPTLPFSVSLWVRIEADTGANFQTIWWHGEAGTDNYVSLRYQKSTGKVQLVAGASYPASVSVLTSTATISFEAWHLVTIVVSRSGSTWTHAMFVDDQTAPTPVTGSGPTSGNPGFDRFVLGQTGASPVQPLDGYAEQVAVWSNHAVTEAEHDRMFAETSDNGFLGLRRAPDAITEPNLAWWMLTGHHRHGLRVDDSQTTVNLGELRNEATTANQPDMQMLDDEIRPTWSVISPLVYYAPVTPGTIPPRPAKRAIHRRSPRFLFFQKPELFEPWKTNEGKHPIYDDPNCAILCRTAYTSVNVPARNPPAFITALYVPQTYITNVARRVADWMQYQGYASDNMLVRADDDARTHHHGPARRRLLFVHRRHAPRLRARRRRALARDRRRARRDVHDRVHRPAPRERAARQGRGGLGRLDSDAPRLPPHRRRGLRPRPRHLLRAPPQPLRRGGHGDGLGPARDGPGGGGRGGRAGELTRWPAGSAARYGPWRPSPRAGGAPGAWRETLLTPARPGTTGAPASSPARSPPPAPTPSARSPPSPRPPSPSPSAAGCPPG